MTILPKNFGGAKKTHRKPTNSQAEHGGHSKGHTKKAVVDRLDRSHPSRHVLPSTQNQAEPLNSDDEYDTGFKDEELEVSFVEQMKSVRGFNVKVVKGDGACMFRAVADQIYGDEEMHYDVRRLCMDYVAKNRDHFSQFITEDFNEYLERKRNVDVHGNHVELQAISEIFLRPIEIYEYHTEPINTFHPISRETNNRQENPPIRLSYHGSVHYNSIIDPFTPTIGVGLGLANYVPGQADQNLMAEAKLASERQHIEEAMLKDKMKMTDWERTEEELQRQVASESYMEYIRQIERHAGQARSKTTNPNDKTTKSTNRWDSSHLSRSTGSKIKNQFESFQSGSKPGVTSKIGSLGVKRGASSPNLPCTSRQTEDTTFSVPLAKIHRNEHSSVSMPNIGESFKSNSNTTSEQLSKSPAVGDNFKFVSEEANVEQEESKAGTSKQEGDGETTSSIGLYEELLASSTAYGDWDEKDDASMLAQVIALSQEEFLENLRKSPRQ